VPDARPAPRPPAPSPADIPAHLNWAVAHFPSGRVHDACRLVGPTAAAVLVDYERDDAVHGTWYSDRMHFFDMTLSRRPTGARGSFEEAAGGARPVGPILFAPSGFHYRGQGGRGRQKSVSLFLDSQRDEALHDAIVRGLEDCVSLEAAGARDLLLRIAREVAEPGFASQLLLEGLSLSLLVETARALRGTRGRAIRKGGLAPAALRTIRDRAVAGPQPPSLAELAALCRLSRRQLVRAFRAETGETIGAFVRAVTIDRAKRMLADTDMPIGDVAAALGFARPSAFATAFRRSCGRTPREFRKAGRETTRLAG
jgi:AraC family transcriptional regulator